MDIGVYGARGIPSTYSGYETFLTELLPELARRGHDVTIYCRRGQVEHAPRYRGVSKLFLPSVETKELSTLSHGLVAAVVARARRHDVVFVTNPANALFCAVAKFTGQAVLLNTDGQEWLRGKWGPIASGVFHQSARLARWTTTGLISDSDAMADVYRGEFGAPSTVIPYCWTNLVPARDDTLMARWRVARGEYALIASRLNPENNALMMAQAYHRSRSELPLLVAGEANYDSPTQRDLSALAVDDHRIRLIGHIGDRGEFGQLLEGSAIYLHGHSVGGINPSLLEAMGCSALVYALDTPFNREALADTGRYFQTASDLTSLLNGASGADGQELRRRAHARVREEFSLDEVAGAHEDLFRLACEKRVRTGLCLGTRWAS